jgi:hypothetical protein
MNIFDRFLQWVGLQHKGPRYPSGQEYVWKSAKSYAEAVFGQPIPDPSNCQHRRCRMKNKGRWVYVGVSGKMVRGEYFPGTRTIVIAVGPDGEPGPSYASAVQHEFGEMGQHLLYGIISRHDPRWSKYFEGW